MKYLSTIGNESIIKGQLCRCDDFPEKMLLPYSQKITQEKCIELCTFVVNLTISVEPIVFSNGDKVTIFCHSTDIYITYFIHNNTQVGICNIGSCITIDPAYEMQIENDTSNTVITYYNKTRDDGYWRCSSAGVLSSYYLLRAVPGK